MAHSAGGWIMRRTNYIALDVHSTFCEGGYTDDLGREKAAWRKPTAIPELVKVIDTVPRPRMLVIEEGPLADYISSIDRHCLVGLERHSVRASVSMDSAILAVKSRNLFKNADASFTGVPLAPIRFAARSILLLTIAFFDENISSKKSANQKNLLGICNSSCLSSHCPSLRLRL
jgi:hypothetical protein